MKHNIDAERTAFEKVASDGGMWPKAIERDAKGDYILMATASGWSWWQTARSAPTAAQGLDALTQAACSVLAERARQIAAEGWTSEQDDAYNPGVLAEAGGIYALHAFDPFRAKEAPEGWPWSPGWWKPKDPRTNLVKAGALILAEIERIDRSYAAQAKQGAAA